MKVFFLNLLLYLTFFLGSAAFGVTIIENPSRQLPHNVALWLDLEINVNPGDNFLRTDKALIIEHLEVPLHLIDHHLSDNLRAEIRDSLIFEKGGTKYLKWILNPEDTAHREEIKANIEALTGTTAEFKTHYIGYLTSSRSTVVHDPITGVLFSIKGSTNKTGGHWTNKKMTAAAAKLTSTFNDFISSKREVDDLETLQIAPEPASFVLSTSDNAITIRDFDIFYKPEVYMVPFFSALSDGWGKNYSKKFLISPGRFWNEHLFEKWGAAIAELNLFYGSYPTSGHSQDFLVAVNSEGLPTGKIYFRDIMDSHGDKTILEKRGAHAVIDVYQSGLKKLKLLEGTRNFESMKLHPFHGTPKPRWYIDDWDTVVKPDYFKKLNQIVGDPEGSIVTKMMDSRVLDFLTTLESQDQQVCYPLIPPSN